MNINSINNVQNFSLLKHLKSDSTIKNPNLTADEMYEPKQKQMVDAQTALASHTIPKINMSFKGSMPESPKEMTDEEFEKFKEILNGTLGLNNISSFYKLDLNEEKLKLLNNTKLRQYIANTYVKFIRTFDSNYDDKVVPSNKINDELFDTLLKIGLSFLNDNDVAGINNLLNNKNLSKNTALLNFSLDMFFAIDKMSTESKKLMDRIIFNSDLLKSKSLTDYGAYMIMAVSSKEQDDIANKILDNPELYDNEIFMKNAIFIIQGLNSYLINDKRLNLANAIVDNKKFYSNKYFMPCVQLLMNKEYSVEEAEKVLELANGKLTGNQIVCIIDDEDKIQYEDCQKLNKTIGFANADRLSLYDTKTAVKFADLYKKQNTNEISRKTKKELLKNLLSQDDFLFAFYSSNMKEMFPIIPTNQRDYCELFPSIVSSLGLNTNVLLDKHFTEELNQLGNTLAKISDEDFKNLDIKQSYSKDEFIDDVSNKIKDLSDGEKQKVFDYFGFELYEHEVNKKDKTTLTVCSISGYPVCLNPESSLSRKKLSRIENPQTLAVIENLRENIIKFTKNNKITCKNEALANDLNNIINALPELRTSIGCFQAGMKDTTGSHQFDIFTHSLKVMQGIVKDPKYQVLSSNDKKIMLLAALLHDITKEEGTTDIKHSDNSSFDASFIIKKFGLSKDDEIKLYTLIKSHEWLGYVNSAETEKERIKRQQSTAYDLRHDNLFDMALIFTHADLKGVNDEFHDKKNEKRISKVDGITRSFGEAAEFHAEKIRQYIEELKPSQPLLPVTKIPSAGTILQAITEVHPDGSTNIQGVYKDKDGLVILKYNELKNEDLEKIGFPKGSITRGIEAEGVASKYDEKSYSYYDIKTKVNTGNIKFFAHGLDHPNQLVKFDAFSLINSDVLLSASYAERPESKYRFFRPQGIILDVDTKYVHGGGETDSGSGTGKYIDDFKQRYLFGGEREGDRKFISNLIKNTLDISTDKDYIDFADKHKNDSFLGIEEEKRNKLIKAYAGIKSKIREGNREYNEMYISNPKTPMAVFAYEMDENVADTGNPIEFLHRTEQTEYEKNAKAKSVQERTEFLRQYALEKHLPFVIFGN